MPQLNPVLLFFPKQVTSKIALCPINSQCKGWGHQQEEDLNSVPIITVANKQEQGSLMLKMLKLPFLDPNICFPMNYTASTAYRFDSMEMEFHSLPRDCVFQGLTVPPW